MKYLLISILLFFSSIIKGQDLHNLLGRSISDADVQELINNLDTTQELFLPYAKMYKLSSVESGIDLEFNSYFVLEKINLFDSGYTYRSYKNDLPLGLGWGWDSARIQDLTDYLKYNESNPYVKSYIDADWTADLYFKNGKLEHLRLTADSSLIMKGIYESSNVWGFRLYPNGQKVNGNTLDGKGVMVWGDGVGKYDGNWSYGVPHGYGIYSDSFGSKYVGNFKLGFFWGDGILNSKQDKFVYEGNFLLGRKQGYGEIYYDNGTTYSGQWYRDMMHGYGIYRMDANNYYKGFMANNMFNGKGILYTKDGYIKGQFKDGRPHGYCEQFATQSGQMLKGYWSNGKKEGEFTMITFGLERTMIFKNDIEIIEGIPTEGNQ